MWNSPLLKKIVFNLFLLLLKLINKRDLITKKTGFNVTKAIEVGAEDETKASQTVQRKASVPVKKTTEPEKVVRKVVTQTK